MVRFAKGEFYENQEPTIGAAFMTQTVNLGDFVEDAKFDENPNLEKVVLLGHSYGGILVAAFTDKWDKEIPLEAHTIAAPLKGMGALNNVCDYQIPVSIDPETTFYEWRTIKELDGAFRDLSFDPQEVEIENSKVIRLPETYKGNKLGHNWSISWVADEIK